MEETEYCLYEGLRVYRNGDIERNFKRLGWKKVRNHNNKGDGYNVLTVKKKQLLRHRLVVAAFNP